MEEEKIITFKDRKSNIGEKLGNTVADKMREKDEEGKDKYDRIKSKGANLGKTAGTAIGEKTGKASSESQLKDQSAMNKGSEIGRKIGKGIGEKGKTDEISQKSNITTKFTSVGLRIGERIFDKKEERENKEEKT